VLQTYRYITLGRLKVGRIPEKSMAKLRIQQAVFWFIQGFLENLQQMSNIETYKQSKIIAHVLPLQHVLKTYSSNCRQSVQVQCHSKISNTKTQSHFVSLVFFSRHPLGLTRCPNREPERLQVNIA